MQLFDSVCESELCTAGKVSTLLVVNPTKDEMCTATGKLGLSKSRGYATYWLSGDQYAAGIQF